MVDHVSDSSIEGSTPLMMLVEAALNGDEKVVDESAGVFTEHATKLVEVANLASANEEGVKMVRYAAHQIQNLCPQVINATWVPASRPRSKVAPGGSRSSLSTASLSQPPLLYLSSRQDRSSCLTKFVS